MTESPRVPRPQNVRALQTLNDARAFAEQHLERMCHELTTADGHIIPEGKVRELAHMLKPLRTGSSLALALDMVRSAAIKRVAKDYK